MQSKGVSPFCLLPRMFSGGATDDTSVCSLQTLTPPSADERPGVQVRSRWYGDGDQRYWPVSGRVWTSPVDHTPRLTVDMSSPAAALTAVYAAVLCCLQAAAADRGPSSPAAYHHHGDCKTLGYMVGDEDSKLVHVRNAIRCYDLGQRNFGAEATAIEFCGSPAETDDWIYYCNEVGLLKGKHYFQDGTMHTAGRKRSTGTMIRTRRDAPRPMREDSTRRLRHRCKTNQNVTFTPDAAVERMQKVTNCYFHGIRDKNAEKWSIDFCKQMTKITEGTIHYCFEINHLKRKREDKFANYASIGKWCRQLRYVPDNETAEKELERKLLFCQGLGQNTTADTFEQQLELLKFYSTL